MTVWDRKTREIPEMMNDFENWYFWFKNPGSIEYGVRFQMCWALRFTWIRKINAFQYKKHIPYPGIWYIWIDIKNFQGNFTPTNNESFGSMSFCVDFNLINISLLLSDFWQTSWSVLIFLKNSTKNTKQTRNTRSFYFLNTKYLPYF